MRLTGCVGQWVLKRAALELAPDRGIDNFMQVFLLFIDIIIYLVERTNTTCAHEKINFYFS